MNYSNSLEVATDISSSIYIKRGHYASLFAFLPSEYGDLEVGDNDGFGVYAIRTLEEHTALIEDLLLYQEPLYAVYFDSPAEWYECVY